MAEELNKLKFPDFHGLSLQAELLSLKDILTVLDKQLLNIDEEAKKYFQNPEFITDGDGDEHIMDLTPWYEDRKESMIALGFVAIQEFLTSIASEEGIDKRTALTYGPHVKPNLTMAQISNDAANYYKHHDEWPQKIIEREQRQITIIANFKEVDIDLDYPDHPLLELLTKISDSNPPSFAFIIPLLDEWGKALLKLRRVK